MSAAPPETRRVAYYTGCTASLPARELDRATRALAPRLGIELVDLPSAGCCGAGEIQQADPDYALHLGARILAQGEQTGAETLLTICNVCTLNLRRASWQLRNDTALRERVNANLERAGAPACSGEIEVEHLLWTISRGDGVERLALAAARGLEGMRIAPFYGCQALRPSKLLGFEDPDRPSSLATVIEVCGGEPVDYPAKTRCCGFPLLQTREQEALRELLQPLEQARAQGAEAVVTSCPLCQRSLDAWQRRAERRADLPIRLPVLHLSQLVGLAVGVERSQLELGRHLVPVEPALRRHGL